MVADVAPASDSLSGCLSRLPYRRARWASERCPRNASRDILPGRTASRIARRNLELCFPEKPVDEIANAKICSTAKRSPISACMIAESAIDVDVVADRAFARVPSTIDGLAASRTLPRRKAVACCSSARTFSHLELCVATRLASTSRITGMYRVMDNDALDWTIHACTACAHVRRRHVHQGRIARDREISSNSGGTAVVRARSGHARQGFSVFVPFFGIQASTITATHHLARLSGAAVIPFFHKRLADGGYAHSPRSATAKISRRTTCVADTARVNEASSNSMVREAPTQYLWVHKRFKTRPPGNTPSVY